MITEQEREWFGVGPCVVEIPSYGFLAVLLAVKWLLVLAITIR